MDHHDRDLARLVRADQHQARAAGGRAGPEQAGPSIAVQVGPRPHVGQRRGQVALGRHRRIADGAGPERVDQVERQLAGRVDLAVVAEPRGRDDERGQREGHLGRVEPLGPLGLPLGPADGDQRDAQAILVVQRGQARDVEGRGQDDLVDVVGDPGRVAEHDLEDLLAAADLQAEFAVGLDLGAVGLGLAEQAVERPVVEVAGQPVAGVGGLAGEGQLGGEQVVVGVRQRVERPVERLGPVPAVVRLPLDPRELGQGIDEVGLGVAPGLLLQGGEDAGRVLAIAARRGRTA